MAKYKTLKMKDLSWAHRKSIATWIQEREKIEGKVSVRCLVCNTEIIPLMKQTYWDAHWTVREQLHEASDEHKAGLLLYKLSGEGDNEPFI